MIEFLSPPAPKKRAKANLEPEQLPLVGTHKLAACFSTGNDEYETPDDTFEHWNDRLRLNCDVAATKDNAKLKNFMTQEQDGLRLSWHGLRVWCNPPYSQIDLWVEKAIRETEIGCPIVCLLLPSRTDRPWFTKLDNLRSQRCYLEYIKGRLKFKGAPSSAPFPSLIAVVFGL